MDKKRGMFIIIFLVLLLGVVNAAWSIYYKKTITSNVVGDRKVFNISQEFGSSISLNTSNSADSDTTLMSIKGLNADMAMNYAIETRKTYLDATCPSPEKDCLVTVTQIYNTGGTETRNILSSTQNINSEKNFTLIKNTDNLIEYKVECIQNSCPQKITSNVTIQQA